MTKTRTAKFQIGQIVRHRILSFRGVIFDIDPEFNNTEQWWLSIPEDVRPHKYQPFYHLLAENSESEYVAYVSEQNLLPDDARERQRQGQRSAVGVDRLHDQILPLFEVGDQFRRHVVVRHAAILEANHIRRLRRRIAVNDNAGSVNQLHAERERDAKNFLRIAFRLDDDCRDHRLARFDAAVLAGKANLLGAGILALQAEFGPGRVDQLNLVGGRLAACRGSTCGGRGRRLRGGSRGRRGFRSGLRRRLWSGGLGRSWSRSGCLGLRG